MNKLGQVGIDRITITNVLDIHGRFPEPLIDYFQKLTDKNLKTDPYIVAKKSKIIFSLGNFSLVCGNYAFGYANLEIHAADKNGNNLYNMQVCDIKKKIPDILNFFQARYGIHFLDKSYYKVSKVEINATFEMKEKTEKYEDCLTLLQYGFSGANGAYATYYTRENMLPKLETLYLVDANDNKNYSIKVYDKIKELESKKCDTYGYDNCLRFEITIKKQCELKAIIPSLMLSDLEDTNITQYFWKRFNKAISRVDSFLQDRMRLPLEITKKVYVPSVATVFMDTILDKGIYGNNLTQSFFQKLIEIEQLIRLPVFVSVLGLEKMIENEMFLSKEKANYCINALKNDESFDIRKEPYIDKIYMRERRWNEIKSKLQNL